MEEVWATVLRNSVAKSEGDEAIILLAYGWMLEE